MLVLLYKKIFFNECKLWECEWLANTFDWVMFDGLFTDLKLNTNKLHLLLEMLSHSMFICKQNS